MNNSVALASNLADQDTWPKKVFDWSDFWQVPGTLSVFVAGPLANSYYQTDRQQQLIRLFDRLVGQRSAAGRVLDVGCGNGAGSASLLAAADQQLCAINIDAIDSANVSPPDGLARRVCFRKGRAEQLEYHDDSFELVLSCFAVEFFDQLAFLSECLRVLKPGGEIAFLMYAAPSPMVSTQSRYVGVYEKGLQQLMDRVQIGQKPDAALLAEIRHHVAEDVPQPHFRVHLNQIVDRLVRGCSEVAGNHMDVDHLFLPDLSGTENVYSLRSLKRYFGLMQVISYAALSVPDARDLVRRMDRSGFDDCCVVPLEFQGMLQCWLVTAAKLRRPCD